MIGNRLGDIKLFPTWENKLITFAPVDEQLPVLSEKNMDGLDAMACIVAQGVIFGVVSVEHPVVPAPYAKE